MGLLSPFGVVRTDDLERAMSVQEQAAFFGLTQQQGKLSGFLGGLLGSPLCQGVPPVLPQGAKKTITFGKGGVEVRDEEEPLEVIRLHHGDMRWIHRYI